MLEEPVRHPSDPRHARGASKSGANVVTALRAPSPSESAGKTGSELARHCVGGEAVPAA